MSDIPPPAPRLKMHEPEGAKRPRPGREHYGARHQRLRKLKLAQVLHICEVQADGCTITATDAHHLRYPATSTEDYVACCPYCHRILERQKRGEITR